MKIDGVVSNRCLTLVGVGLTLPSGIDRFTGEYR